MLVLFRPSNNHSMNLHLYIFIYFHIDRLLKALNSYHIKPFTHIYSLGSESTIYASCSSANHSHILSHTNSYAHGCNFGFIMWPKDTSNKQLNCSVLFMVTLQQSPGGRISESEILY